ncbi:MAG: tetratricopeptide repeat protein [Calditrichaeota bacterium]|nr:MAG: tetratricopeptide repeat protein [Calditrichota bacterium]
MAQLRNVEALEKHLQENPNSVVFALLAKHYLDQGDVDRALSLCEEGVRKHSRYDFGHYVMALCLFEKKDFARAREHLELALALNEKNPAGWKLLGEINSQLNQPQQAQDATARYFALDMFNPDAAQRMEKASLLELSLFEESESTEPESQSEMVTGEELFPEEQFETLFEKADTGSTQMETPSEEEVEDVLRETLGDLSTLDAGEPSEQRGETLDMGEQGSAAEASETEKDFSSAIDYFFSEIEEEEAQQEAGGAEAEAESESPQATNPEESPETGAESEETLLEADEELLEAAAPEEAESGETEPLQEDLLAGGEEELLDFSSVVENIISDRKEELSGQDEDESAGATSVTIIHEEEGEGEAPTSAEAEPSQSPEGPAGEEGEDFSLAEEEAGEAPESAQIGKPPIVSPTLGEIYIAQGRFEEAIEVFQKLLEKEPDNPKYKKKIQFIQELQAKQQAGDLGDQG